MTSSANARTSASGRGPYGPRAVSPTYSDRLVRQLVEDGAGDGEPADAGVEDADGSVRHGPPRVRVRRRAARSVTSRVVSATTSVILRALAASQARSGPELALEAVLGLVEGALVGAGRQVLPAAVAHDERDVGRPAGLDRLAPRRRAPRAGSPRWRCRRRCPPRSSSSRVRRTASRGPTEKRVVEHGRRRTARGRSPRRGCAGRRPARRSAARRRRSRCRARARAGTGRRPSACRWCRARRRSG